MYFVFRRTSQYRIEYLSFEWLTAYKLNLFNYYQYV